MNRPLHPLLHVRRKELAAALGCAPSYVSAMRRAGLPLNADAALALAWLARHPDFRKRRSYPSAGTQGDAREQAGTLVA